MQPRTNGFLLERHSGEGRNPCLVERIRLNPTPKLRTPWIPTFVGMTPVLSATHFL
jgi:hypothetical protein